MVVTVVILLISLAAYGFLTLMQTENKAARARGDQLQAQAVAASGREYLASVLELPRSQRPEGAEVGDLAEVFGNVLVDGDQEERDETTRQGRFSVLAPDNSETSTRGWRFGYENESAKINLARLLDRERREPGAARDALMNLPYMDESTADAILDWIDPDDQARDLGAESEYYLGLTPPRRPRNGLPPSLEELLLVKGVTREKLLGTDLNANFRLDDSEDELAKQQAEIASDSGTPWCQFLTVRSAERDETFDGQPRVQLNQADLGSLHGELASALEPAWANYIVAYRQYGPYRGSGEADVAENLAIDLSVPAKTWIRSPLELIATRVGIPDDEKKGARVRQPLYVGPGRYARVPADVDGGRYGGQGNALVRPSECESGAAGGVGGPTGDRYGAGRSHRFRSIVTLRHRSTAAARSLAADRGDCRSLGHDAVGAVCDDRRGCGTCTDYRLLRSTYPADAVRDGG